MNNDLVGEIPDLGGAVVKAVTSDEGAAFIADVGETALDQALKEGVLREIPVVRSIHGLVKAGLGIKEYLFLRKLGLFLEPVRRVELEERIAWAERIEEDSGFRDKVVGGLVLFLDQMNDLEKAQLLGRAFAAYLRQHIDHLTFRRLANAIDRVEIADLSRLKKLAGPPVQDDRLLVLAAVGLVSAEVISSYGASPLAYSVSELGYAMLHHCLSKTTDL